MGRISIIVLFVFLGLVLWFALEGFVTRYISLIPVLFAIQISLNDVLELYILKRAGRNLFSLVIAPGTIAHELSHLVAAVITGCEIKRVNLFRLNSRTGTLGYVEYSSRRDEFEFLRNLIVGFAPFFGCGLLLILLLNIGNSITGENLLDVNVDLEGSVFLIIEKFLNQFYYLDSYPVILIILYLQLCLGLGSAPSSQDFRISGRSLRGKWLSVVLLLLVVASVIIVGEYAQALGDYGTKISETIKLGFRFSVIVLLISVMFLLLSVPFIFILMKFSEIGTVGKISTLVISGIALILTDSFLLSGGAFLLFLLVFRYQWVFLKPKS